MLRYGSYPAALKSRILSQNGHLSNKDCAKTLAYLASKGLERAVLAHLSENNNTPLTARKCAVDELKKYGFDSVDIKTAEPMLEMEL
jgi:phosphoribosyl 1,2-cyclic phosphodiesterase